MRLNKTLLGILMTVFVVVPAPVLKFFGSRTPTPIPDRKSWKTKSYTTTWFDMWRIKEGKADEHWDPARKEPR